MLILIMYMLMTAGCTTTPVLDNRTAETHTPITTHSVVPESKAPYQGTLTQPDNTIPPDFIKMDSGVFNKGEVIEFYLVNEGSGTLTCYNTPPSVTIFRQMANDSWEIQLEFEETKVPAISYVKPGESTRARRITTTNLLPGRYKVVFDCGISREFEIRKI